MTNTAAYESPRRGAERAVSPREAPGRELFVSDLDGTLLTPDADLSPYAVQVLNRLYERNIPFTVSTARTAATVAAILEKVRLSVPVILMNGVCSYDTSSGHYCDVAYFGSDGSRQLAELLEERGGGGFLYAISGDRLDTFWAGERTGHELAFMREREERYGKRFTRVDSLAFMLRSSRDAVYYSRAGKKEALEPLAASLAGSNGLRVEFYRDIYREDYRYLEVCSAAASKRSSLERLRERFGFARITGFGDNLNDLPLFEACDRRIAVANACEELRAAAGLVIPSNREDGVAHWLDDALLK